MLGIEPLPDYRQRREAFAEVEADLNGVAGSVRDTRNLWAVVVAPRATVSEQLGNVFVSLLLPALSAAMEAESTEMKTGSLGSRTSGTISESACPRRDSKCGRANHWAFGDVIHGEAWSGA